ncbi:hypothetical protein GCM10027185_51920 [Spirosoma pulveris]
MYIPTADVQDEGTFTIGYGFNPSNYAFRYNQKNSESIAFVNLCFLPRLEVNINLLNPNGPIRFGDKGIGDRQMDLKYVMLTEKTKRPSVAIILSAPFGIANSLVTNALVATKHVSITKLITTAFTIGVGSPYTFSRAGVSNDQNADVFSGYSLKDKRDNPYYYLAGPFAGVNLTIAKKGGLMIEWDSQHLNVGLYTRLVRHWNLQAGLLNGDQLTFGTSYSLNLFQLPKRLSAKHSQSK